MVRQRHVIALVGSFLIGCAVLLMAGASVVQAQASKKEEGRCQGTRTIKHGRYITNDIPGCPKGGLLLGTDKSDGLPADWPGLDGGDGDDTIRALGGSDYIFHGSGDDVVYGGDGDDEVFPDSGHDVIYGGDGNDKLYSNDVDGGDKLYCGAGRDKYIANKNDYVDSSCEKKLKPPRHCCAAHRRVITAMSRVGMDGHRHRWRSVRHARHDYPGSAA